MMSFLTFITEFFMNFELFPILTDYANCLCSSNLGTFWLKIKQFWPFEEISIFSNAMQPMSIYICRVPFTDILITF
jgi:hypothetical protein